MFVWEHLQSSEGQSRGAWLGMNFNPKGGYPGCGIRREGEALRCGEDAFHQGSVGVRTWGEVRIGSRTDLLSHLRLSPRPLSTLSPTGGTLVWQDNTAVNYSNWGPPGLGPSMLSHNSCYWIQSSSGLWRPGACTNITMGVVCKLPRGGCLAGTAQPPATPAQLARGLGRGPVTRWTGGQDRTGPGRQDPPLG